MIYFDKTLVFVLTVYCMVSKLSVVRSRMTDTDPEIGSTAKKSWAG